MRWYGVGPEEITEIFLKNPGNNGHQALRQCVGEAASPEKKQGRERLEDLIGMITKHLKKGERVKIAGLGILVGVIVLPA